MPSHTPRGLYQLSLITVLKEIRHWMPADNSSPKVSPFSVLPSVIAQDLLDAYERVYDTPGHNISPREQARWRLFLTCQVTRVRVTTATDKLSLRHIATGCQGVRSLEVHKVSSADQTLIILKELLKSLHSLNYLDIQLCTLNASAIKVIRDECHNLRVLRLGTCNLNDKAISCLKKMPTLVELDLRETEVSAGAAARLIKRNPQLVLVKHSNLLRTLGKIAKTSTVLQIREIQLAIIEYSSSSINSVVKTCPKLEQINIELDYEVPNTILIPLAQLKYLNELHIHCICEHVSLSPKLSETLFAESIIPILKSRGKQLKALSLECVEGVDLKQLEVLCPYLQSLTLYFNSYVTPNVLPTFSALRKLQFGSQAGGDDNMTSVTLKSLLIGTTSLEDLSLASSPLYSEKLFQEVFERNKFSCLHRLELDYCDLPLCAIDGFLSSASLVQMSICGHRAHEQASRALNIIRAKSLLTHLEAYTYSFMRCHKRIVRYKQILDVRD